MSPLPGLSEIEGASWDYLSTAAANWNKLADRWQKSFTEVRTQSMHPGGTEWTGTAADAAQARTDGDMMRVRGPAEHLRDAAKVAERGRDQQEASRRTALSAVDDVRRQGFNVADDYTTTDAQTDWSSPDEYLGRQKAAKEHEEFIKSQVGRLVEGENDLSREMTAATQELDDFTFPAEMGADGGAGAAGLPHATLADDVLRRGESRNLGPVAGTGAVPGVPGIGAADLGEVVTLPNGKQVMILGDSFAGGKMGEGAHYPSAAVPIHFENGKMVIDGPPLTGPDGSNVLFRLPPQAAGTNTLPAGSIRMRDGTTYMMVAGTKDLNPTGGSWLTKVTDDPSRGWQPIEGSWRDWTPNAPPSPDNKFHPGTAPISHPTQISGYQAADGNVYIAADAFDRSQGVSMYRVDPADVTNRDMWQPWNGNGWGNPGQVAVSPPGGDTYGELSFQEVGGQPVLSGFNADAGSVNLYVADSPTNVFGGTPTVVAPGGHWDNPVPGTYPQNYGGYILPGSTLDDMGILVSQWNTKTDTPYVVEQFQVNPNR